MYLMIADGSEMYRYSTIEDAKEAAMELANDGFVDFEIYELGHPIIEGYAEGIRWSEKKE